MAETKTERKVTVILATDVVGYSVKMEETPSGWLCYNSGTSQIK